MSVSLNVDERRCLLETARSELEAAVRGEPVPEVRMELIPPRLLEPGASFVTLTASGSLRGCIGTLEARQPLIDDVREHAVAAALEDFRFTPVQPTELPGIEIEISRLTAPWPLVYADSEDLLAKLRPNVDGVVILDGIRRATFLPQVWAKIPDPADFLDNLCYKMGAPVDYWRRTRLDVLVYEVEEFRERQTDLVQDGKASANLTAMKPASRSVKAPPPRVSENGGER
jgi:AmmeMemoRadiSam system protein A